MTLRDELLAEPDRAERQRIKARAFAELASLAGQSWTRGLFTATITDGPRLNLPMRAIELSVRVERAGVGDVTPASLNPIVIVNPPILVPDPAGDVIMETGERYRLDLRAALLDTVRDTLRLQIGL